MTLPRQSESGPAKRAIPRCNRQHDKSWGSGGQSVTPPFFMCCCIVTKKALSGLVGKKGGEQEGGAPHAKGERGRGLYIPCNYSFCSSESVAPVSFRLPDAGRLSNRNMLNGRKVIPNGRNCSVKRGLRCPIIFCGCSQPENRSAKYRSVFSGLSHCSDSPESRFSGGRSESVCSFR